MQVEHFNKITSLLLNTPFITKINSDPAFVSDVDALEDWEDFEALTHLANEKHGTKGLSHIHPFGNELINFREKAMPRLKTQIPLYADFPAYMNDLYKSLEMEKVPFDVNEKYQSSPEKLDQTETAYNWYREKTHKIMAQNENL